MAALGERWHRLPIVWLGATIFFASIAACIGMIVLASRYPDDPIPLRSDQLLKMPTTRASEPSP